MLTTATRQGLRSIVADWRRAGARIAFVPTMGDLHAGHLRLVDEARARADRVIVSIFVNPLQFNDPGDLAAYPRVVAEDGELLRARGVDLLFAPSVEEVYPHGMEAVTRVSVPGLSDILCGQYRPGHFTGVTTVVATLFNIVQADCALFGAKDYQQLLLIRRMVEDLAFPLAIVAVDTVREPDGLALSSRNRRLSPADRLRAPALYRALQAVRERLLAGEQDPATLETHALQWLENGGLRPEYISIRRAGDLALPQAGDRELVVLAAAWLGSTRLIDNLAV